MYRSKAPISKYRRVPKDTKPADNNEIRIKNNNPAFSYVAYAYKLFFEENVDFVYLNSTGPATSNAIKVVEILRAGIRNLHVQYKIVGTEFVDEYEPLEEGLDRVVETRTISSLQITLTVSQGKEIEGTPGYMEPLPTDDVDEDKFKRDIENYNKRKDDRIERIKTRKERNENRNEGDEEDGEEEKRERRPRQRGGRPRGNGGNRGEHRGEHRGGEHRGGEHRVENRERRYNGNGGDGENQAERPRRGRGRGGRGRGGPRPEGGDREYRGERRQDDQDGERPPRRGRGGNAGRGRGAPRTDREGDNYNRPPRGEGNGYGNRQPRGDGEYNRPPREGGDYTRTRGSGRGGNRRPPTRNQDE